MGMIVGVIKSLCALNVMLNIIDEARLMKQLKIYKNVEQNTSKVLEGSSISMQKICDLINALEAIGQEYVGMAYDKSLNLHKIYAFDPKFAKKLGYEKPNRRFVRDGVDYNNLYRAWRDKGTYLLYADKDLDVAIQSSLDKLAVAT